jgi:hypothetical protein
VVNHPTTPDETISNGDDDPKLRFLREKLDDALTDLAVLDKAGCSRKEALKAWDKVFCTEYFSNRATEDTKTIAGAPAIVTSGILKSVASAAGPQSAVRKEGGGRFA